MNRKFNRKQIRAYAAAFEDGDAIWYEGEWREVITNAKRMEHDERFKDDKRLTTVYGNHYCVNLGEENNFIPYLQGFIAGEPYRITTLVDYYPQGGEKLVWLGGKGVMLGEVLETFVDDYGNVVYEGESGFVRPSNRNWAVIPRYEQVKNSGKDDSDKVNDKMNERPASSHYHDNNNGNDVWKFADDNLSEERVKGFHQINAIKYVSRYHKKHDTTEKRIEDLEKAKVSIDKLIELERKG